MGRAGINSICDQMKDSGCPGQKSREPDARHPGEEMPEVKGRDLYIPEGSDLIYPVSKQVICLSPMPFKKSKEWPGGRW